MILSIPVTEDRIFNFSELGRFFNFRVEDVIIHHELDDYWMDNNPRT